MGGEGVRNIWRSSGCAPNVLLLLDDKSKAWLLHKRNVHQVWSTSVMYTFMCILFMHTSCIKRRTCVLEEDCKRVESGRLGWVQREASVPDQSPRPVTQASCGEQARHGD